MIHARTEGLDLPVEKVCRYVACNLKNEHNKKHSTTGVTQNEAKRDGNKLKVRLNIKTQA